MNMNRSMRRYFPAACAAALLMIHVPSLAARDPAAAKKPAAAAPESPGAANPDIARPDSKKTPDTKPAANKPDSNKPAAAKPTATKPAKKPAAKPAVVAKPVELKPTAEQLAADPFDGQSLTGWMTVDGKPAGDGWEVIDGVIHRKPGGKAGNIVTARQFGDFDLSFEWKIALKGNSGLKYRVRSYGGSWLGLEYQIYDDGSVKKVKTRGSAGAIYDLYEPNDEKALNPVGEYNTARIVVKEGRIEHWLNGKLIAQATVGDKEWDKRMGESKFADRKDFALNEQGKLMLTDHGTEVWYRNFRMNAAK
jgi:hypothetical protein